MRFRGAYVRRARDDVDVEVEDVLPRRRARVHDDVHPRAAGGLLHRVGEAEGDVVQVPADFARQVLERLEVLARHHEHVPRVHRLDVHERDGGGVLVADGHLGRAVDDVAEDALPPRAGGHVVPLVGAGGWESRSAI